MSEAKQPISIPRLKDNLPARNCYQLFAIFRAMPTRYREVLEYMQGYLAAYPLGFEADETGQRNIVADRNGYRLGESGDLAVIEEMVKGENKAFADNMQRKTFRQLIAMFASLTSPDENGKQRAVVSDQAGV